MPSNQYEVELTPQAEKDLKRLRPWIDQATTAVLALEHDPYRGHFLAGSLKGARSLEFSLKGAAHTGPCT